MPADIDLAGAEIEIARMDDHLTRLAQALQVLRSDQTFDYILLDCPPSLGILMTNALAAADELLTPIQCEYFALEGLVKIVRLIERIQSSGANRRLEIGGIIMTMFDSRTKISAQVVAEVREHFFYRVYETMIPRTVRLSEAPSFGKTILEHDPTASARKLIARWRRIPAPARPRHPERSGAQRNGVAGFSGLTRGRRAVSLGAGGSPAKSARICSG